MSSMPSSLYDQLQSHRFRCRLERAAMIRDSAACEERQREAHRMAREIALRRVFDQFTKDQESELLQILQPVACPTDPGPPDGRQSRLF